jgi:hypothetical protein
MTISNQICLQDTLLNIQSDDFKSVRVVINPSENKEHGVWVSVFDLLQYVAKKNSPREVLKRINDQHPEVVTWCDNFQFNGPGQRLTPIMSLRKSVQLLQLTPGEAGQKVRTASAELLCRHVAGDESLIEEIQANRVEQERLSVEEPSNPMRLFAVDQQIRRDDDYPEMAALKRRKLQADLLRDITETERQIVVNETETHMCRVKVYQESLRIAKEITGLDADDRQKQLLLDLVSNHARKSVLATASTTTTSSSLPLQLANSTVPEEICLTTWLVEKKVDTKNAAIFGKIVASIAREKSIDIKKVNKTVNGTIVPVNLWTEENRDIIEEAFEKLCQTMITKTTKTCRKRRRAAAVVLNEDDNDT